LFADLWIEQSDILLRGVSLVPLVQAAILAGWYALKRDGQDVLATAAAASGALVMILATIYLARTVQYVAYFRDRMGPLIESVPTGWVNGKRACLLVPVLCLLANLTLIVASRWIAVKVEP
jgi:hypothetical protein